MAKILYTSKQFPTKGEAARNATRRANKGEWSVAAIATPRKSHAGEGWVYDIMGDDEDDEMPPRELDGADGDGGEVAPVEVEAPPAPTARKAKGRTTRTAKVEAAPVEVEASEAPAEVVDAPAVEVAAPTSARRGRKGKAGVQEDAPVADQVEEPPALVEAADTPVPVEEVTPAPDVPAGPLSMSEVAEMQGQTPAALAAAPAPAEVVDDTPAPAAADDAPAPASDAPSADTAPAADAQIDTNPAPIANAPATPGEVAASHRPGATDTFTVRLRDACVWTHALAVAQSVAKRMGLVVELVDQTGAVVRTVTGREKVARDPAAPRVAGERAPRAPRADAAGPAPRIAAMIALAVRKEGVTRHGLAHLADRKQPWTQLLKEAAEKYGYRYDSTRDGKYTTYFLTKIEAAQAA